jgi:preprotein translocase subunit SecY
MSSFHGLFSVGGIVGSLLGGSLLSVGVSPFAIAVLLVVVVAGVFLRYLRYLDAESPGDRQSPALVLPRGVVVPMAAIAIENIAIARTVSGWRTV